MKGLSKRTRIVLIIIATLVALIFTLRFGWEVILTAKLKRVAREAGLSWPPQFETTPIPDDQNAATIYQEAFELLEGSPGFWKPGSDQPEHLRKEAAAYENLLAKLDNGDFQNISEEVNALRDWRARNEESIALLVRAAALENSDFPGDPLDLLPHLGRMRESSRILRLAAIMAAADGDPARAAELGWTILRAGNHLGQGNHVIANLVRCAICALSRSALENVSSIATIPEDWRERIDDELIRYTDLDTWADLRGEKLAFLQFMELFSMQSLFAGPVELPEDDISPGPSPADLPQPNQFVKLITGLLTKLITGVWIKPNLIKGLELMAEFEDICRQPYWKARPELLRWDTTVSNLSGFYSLSNLSLGGMTRYPEQVARAQARALAARLGLALSAHKQQTGSYPDDLTVLSPDLIDEIPLDPFTGEPFIYRKEADGFILYSIGPNLTDDDGVYVYDNKARKALKDDISWRMSH